MIDNPAPHDGAASSPPAPLSTLTTRPVSRAATGASLPPAVFAAPPPILPAITAAPIPRTGPVVPAKVTAPPRQRVMVRGLAVVLGLLALSALAWFVFDPLGTDGVTPIQTFADQGRTHIAPGQPHPAYNSIPATSGWHREEFPPNHFLTAPIEDEVSVHVLEHGNVFVFYDCSSGGCDQLRSQLTAVVQTELDARAGEGVYLGPRALPNGHKIALAAWTHLQYLDKPKDSVIRAFCDTYLGVMNESKPVVPPTP